MLNRLKAERDFIIFVAMILFFAVFAYTLAFPIKLWADLNGFHSQHEILVAFGLFGCEICAALWVVTLWESRSRKN